MRSKIETDYNKNAFPQALLAQLAEDLKLPLTLIARKCESSALLPQTAASNLSSILATSSSAIRLVEAYSLALKLANLEANSLVLEPISAAAIFTEIIDELKPLAAKNHVILESLVSKHGALILTNRRALITALLSVGQNLLESFANDSKPGQRKLELSAVNVKNGIRAGWYWNGAKIDAEILRRGQGTVGFSRSPLAPFSTSPSSGIFIASSILRCLGSVLEVSKSRNLSGLTSKLPLSQQLVLV